MKSFNIYYFDGKSSKPIKTTLELSEHSIYISDTNTYYEFKDVNVGIKLNKTPQRVYFSDGSSAQIEDDELFSLPNQRGDSFVRTLEGKLKYAITAFVAIVLLAVFSLTFGSTAISNALADKIPQSISNMLSDNALRFIDKTYLAPSNLSESKQKYIVDEFNKLVTNSSHNYTLNFRSSTYFGANAFALPSGDIVLLDDLVYMDEDEKLRGILSILAHEAGHVEYNHGLKSIIKASITSAIIGYFVGDFSGLATSFATFTINADYSRDFEREADIYAVKLSKENNISTKYIADIFEQFLDEDEENMSFLSSHPLTKERIEYFRNESL